MKKSSIFLLIMMMLGGAAHSQEYHTIPPFAAGVRGSLDGGGVNFRYFANDLVSLEGQLNVSGGRPNGLPTNSGKSVTGVALVQLNLPVFTTQYRIFLGGGIHYGSWERYKTISVPEGAFGFDGIIGAEYTFQEVPVSVSIDYKPAVSYLKGTQYFPNNNAGLSLRYYFGKWSPQRAKMKAERRKMKEQWRR